MCQPSSLRKTATLKSRICLLLAVLLPLAVLSVTAHAADGDLRLCDTTVTNSCTVTTDIGRLEIEYNGVWKGVCDDYFTSHEARVACGQLNYPNSQYAKTLLKLDGPMRAHHHNGEFWLDDLLCGQGDNTVDNKLMDCARAGSGVGNEIEPGESGYWGEHNCKSNEYAGVVCVITAPAKPTNLEAEATEQERSCLTGGLPILMSRATKSRSQKIAALTGMILKKTPGIRTRHIPTAASLPETRAITGSRRSTPRVHPHLQT